jgi:NADH-quinone oxidoreductase subunit F
MASPDLAVAEQILARHGRTPDAVIPILQAVQEHYGYLPANVLNYICANTEIAPAAVTGIATFYDMFRLKPVGEHLIRICHGTACHVTGSERVEEAFRRHLKIAANDDTDPDGRFTVEKVACLGCCTLAPVVRIEHSTFGHVTAEKAPSILRDFLEWKESGDGAALATEGAIETAGAEAEIHVGLGSCCMAKGSDRLFQALQTSVQQAGLKVAVKRVGCVGMCHRTPLVEVALPGQSGRFYAGMTAPQACQLVERHFRPRNLWQRLSRSVNHALDYLLVDQAADPLETCVLDRREAGVTAFLGRQVHIATEHFGKIDPLNLDEYLASGGFAALKHCLAPADSEPIIQALEKSGLRGRGGAGFPTGQKWRIVRQQVGEPKYVICNGDEGDPGAFMDRMLLESFPYRIIEGLAIAAVAVGAHECFFYIRHEYPLAVRRVRAALAECQRRGLLGSRVLGADYSLQMSVKEGAGAFVCGEETALIASVEGRRGMPRLRPPFPAESGLWGQPTLINNVETLAQVPWIIRRGPEAFAAIGAAGSKGTKVFALAGRVRRAGLIEVPMGTTIRQVVEEIGGGPAEGHRFKAVQIGGPSGGCVPARLADTPIDYESLRELGAIMGSGGLVVLDDSTCMVDIARYFLQFTQDQSCGRCTFCRIGTRRMLELLERLCAGKGLPEHLGELEQLALSVSQGSLCGLGKTAPNPVLTTLRYYREEYEAHLRGRCPARKCQALIKYLVTDRCTGCTLCAQHCPVTAIPMTPYQKHHIDLSLCTRCDSCRQVCPHHAIEVE